MHKGALFSAASSFNQDISAWDVSRVVRMDSTFFFTRLTFDLTSWDVSRVTDMTSIFEGSNYRGDISSWNTSRVVTMVSKAAVLSPVAA